MFDLYKSRHSFLDLIQMGFLLTDIHSKIIYTNRYTESLFGYTKEELEGQRLRLLFFEDDLIYLLPNIIYLTLYKEGFEGDGLLRQKDGKGIFIHLSSSSFQEEGETFLTFSFQEIQRLKRLEREQLELRRWAHLGMMVEEIAHQVRNPIMAIGGFLQRLKKVPSPSSRAETYMERILQETKRLEEIVLRMEELVKMPRPIFQKEKVLEILESVVQTVSQTEKARDLSIRLEEGTLAGEESFYIDRALVHRALTRILENSIESVHRVKGKQDRKKITISVASHEETIEIVVSDRGEGIAKKDLSHIFEPFFSTKPGQIGLGLTFVKKVIEDHGGHIWVNSRRRRGTEVRITFPKDRRRAIRRQWISPEAQPSPARS